MVSGYERAVKSLWKGLCTVTVRGHKEDPATRIMKAAETTPIIDEPCRLSFHSISPAGQGVAADVPQQVKLIISKELKIPVGSKITVTQNGVTKDYARSGLPAVYSVHQEIPLELFQKWA